MPNMGSASAQLATSGSAVTPPHGVSHPRPGHSLLEAHEDGPASRGLWQALAGVFSGLLGFQLLRGVA